MMIQRCGTDYNQDDQDACGIVFDDAARMTLCPHPTLDDPSWREQVNSWPQIKERERATVYEWMIVSCNSSLTGDSGPYVTANEGLGDEVSFVHRWRSGTVDYTIRTVWARGFKTEVEARQALMYVLPKPPQGWKNQREGCEAWLMLTEDTEQDGVFRIMDTYGGFQHATDTLHGGVIEIIDTCFTPHTYNLDDAAYFVNVEKPWVRLREKVINR